jgi:hypothetical protein
MSDRAKIVFIDDRPDTVRGLAQRLRRAGFTTLVEHPQSLEAEHLKDASLVLVDFVLEDKYWPERAGLPYAARLQDGLAVAGSLRAWLHADDDQAASEHRRPTAITLHSAELKRLSREIPLEIREYALARVHGLEWIFAKAEAAGEERSLHQRIATLATAMQAVPSSWPVDAEANAGDLKEFLGLDLAPVPFSGAAWGDVLDCHPPLHELSTASRGLAIIRWLAQRILPYPCFLVDPWQLAVKLRLEREGLDKLLSARKDPLMLKLDGARYQGAMAGFLGPRWWRAAVDQLLWELTAGGLIDRGVLIDALAKTSNLKLRFLDFANPVTVVDATYESTGIAPAGNCVRLLLDDWPAFAAEPWTTIEATTADPALAARVVPGDRDRLPSS